MGAQRTVDQLSGFETFATSRGRTGCLYRIQLRQSRDADCVFSLTSSCSTSVSRNTRGYFSDILTASCHSLWYFPVIGFFTFMLYYLIPFLNQGSAGCFEEFRDKLWNKNTYILKYRAKCEISFELSRKFLTDNGQYWCNLHALPAALFVCARARARVCVCMACSSFHG